MDKFIVHYVKEGRQQKTEVKVPKGKNSSTTRAFNQFFRKMSQKGFNKKNVKVQCIYRV